MAEHSDSKHRSGGHGPGRWVMIGFALIAGYFLLTEHRAHVVQYLPFLLVLACPLMHFFHRHGGHGGANEKPSTGEKRSQDNNTAGETKHAGGCH